MCGLHITICTPESTVSEGFECIYMRVSLCLCSHVSCVCDDYRTQCITQQMLPKEMGWRSTLPEIKHLDLMWWRVNDDDSASLFISRVPNISLLVKNMLQYNITIQKHCIIRQTTTSTNEFWERAPDGIILGIKYRMTQN